MKNKRLEIENISAEELLDEIMAKLLSTYNVTLREKEQEAKTKVDEQDDEFITIKETCEILKITKPTLGRWRKIGIVTDYRIGNGVRFKKSEVLDSLKKISR